MANETCGECGKGKTTGYNGVYAQCLVCNAEAALHRKCLGRFEKKHGDNCRFGSTDTKGTN